jgi:hypothetical protein
MKFFAIVLLLSVASVSCVAQAAHDEESIRSARAVSNKAIAASDIAGFAASLEPGFVVVTGNGSLLSREAYVATFAKDFEEPHSVRFERIVDSIEISSSVPLAAEHVTGWDIFRVGLPSFAGRIWRCGEDRRVGGSSGRSCLSRWPATTQLPVRVTGRDMERGRRTRDRNNASER